MTPFTFNDYKLYLKAFFDQHDGRGVKAQLAEAAGCQASFVSQMLSGSVHLTLDHAVGIAKFLKLNDLERDYFYCLVGTARAATPLLRKHYQEKMQALKNQNDQLAVRFKETISENEPIPEYHSNWKYRAFHMACTIPRLQTVEAIAKHFQMNSVDVEKDLRKLQSWGYLTEKSGHWKATQKSLHLPKGHFMNAVSHRNWRLKNLECLEKNPSEEALSYSAVYSMSRADFEKLKEMTIRYMEESRRLVVDSKEEELVSFTLDCLIL